LIGSRRQPALPRRRHFSAPGHRPVWHAPDGGQRVACRRTRGASGAGRVRVTRDRPSGVMPQRKEKAVDDAAPNAEPRVRHRKGRRRRTEGERKSSWDDDPVAAARSLVVREEAIVVAEVEDTRPRTPARVASPRTKARPGAVAWEQGPTCASPLVTDPGVAPLNSRELRDRHRRVAGASRVSAGNPHRSGLSKLLRISSTPREPARTCRARQPARSVGGSGSHHVAALELGQFPEAYRQQAWSGV